MKKETVIKTLLTIIGVLIICIVGYYVQKQSDMDKAQWVAIKSLRQYQSSK